MTKSLFWVTGLCLALAGPAVAQSFRIVAPTAGAMLHPGDLVEVRWDRPPAGALEMELLLSIDGGRHFSVRLTDELQPSECTYAWRIPGFATAEARLAMRMNLDGREVVVGSSAGFAIAPPADAEVRPWSLRLARGEFWPVEGDVGFWSDDEPAGAGEPEGWHFAAPERSLMPSPPGVAILTACWSQVAVLEAGAEPASHCRISLTLATLIARTADRAPLVTPLRT